MLVKALRENIRMPGGQSFRLIRWAENLGEVESVGASGVVESISGEGGHWHYHTEMELTWFREGRGTRFVGDGISSFGGGDLVLLGGNLPHYWHVDGPSSGISIQWNFPRGHAFWSFPESAGVQGLMKNASRGLRFRGRNAGKIIGVMEEMAAMGGMERLGGLFGILGHLSGRERSGDMMISRKSFSLAERSVHRAAMEKAHGYVIENFRGRMNLEELLDLTGMSRATFGRQFRIHVGRSFSEFLLCLRVETACRELQETGKTVTEIAYGCGFGQISFFNRSFRKLIGSTPSEYRSGRRGDREG